MLPVVRAVVSCGALLTLVSSSQPSPADAPAAETRQTIRRHFTPADRDNRRYQYVPFDVAERVTALTIEYAYDNAAGASVIDLGLIEPGPVTLGNTRFRGYSGGATRSVTIAHDRATPGYLAGPIPPGHWQVLLGLYRIAPAGVDVAVDITVTSDATAHALAISPPATAAAPLVPAGPRWFGGGLHLHTTHSDGSISPNAIASKARDAGLDFIAITDHNNTTHRHETVDFGTPLRIVGEEITTPAGHANAWGLRLGALIDFRIRPDDPSAATAINGLVAATHAAGALFSINHPFGECAGCSWEQTLPAALDAIEIWNGRVGPQAEALRLWDRLLESGKRVTAVGASDWHRGPDPIDTPSVRVFAPTLSEPDVLAAIRSGRVIVMRSAGDAPPLVVARCEKSEAGVGDSLSCATGDAATVNVSMPGSPEARVDLVWNGDTIASKPVAAAAFTLPAGSGYARVHVVAPDGATIAITNPVYVTHSK